MRQVKRREDYVGFTFNNIHSSQFGLKSVSDGDRYAQYLFPELSDLTEDRTNRDGVDFISTNYKRRTFSLNIVFEDLTESELRELRIWLSDRNVRRLVFDERPYVFYNAKIFAAPQITFLTFCHVENLRVYKGEFQLNFVCYDPYGHCEEKSLNSFSNLQNLAEWADSSRLLLQSQITSESLYSASAVSSSYDQIKLYNCGDIDSDFTLTFNYTAAAHSHISGEQKIGLYSYTLQQPSPVLEKYLALDFSKISSDVGTATEGSITIDGARRTIYHQYTYNNIIYKKMCNDIWVGGNFFKLPADQTSKDRHMVKMSVDSPATMPTYPSTALSINFNFNYL